MDRFGRTVAAAVVAAAGLLSMAVRAEPLMTTFEFSQPAYKDTATSTSVVVTVTRTDQDPGTERTASFTVNCKMIGGTAVENTDYRLDVARPVPGMWKLTFAPGVKAQSFTITTIKKPGADKTLQFQLQEPEGAGSAVTGNNATTTVTIVNPRSAPPKKTS